MVVHANDRARGVRGLPTIELGATVRERQKILSVVDPRGPKRVNAKVHESQVDKLAPKMRARVRIDAFASQVFDATVIDVAPLPDPWIAGQVSPRVYTTNLRIENPAALRPGMTAEVEILVAQRDNVLSVPVQAIVHYQGKDHAAVKKPGGGIEWRDVTCGLSNDKYVEITQGINSGDTVVLNPTSLMSDEEKRQKLGAPVKPNAPR